MRTKITECIQKVANKMELYPWHDVVAYGNWLSQAFYFVEHSTPMLALSAGLSVKNRPYHLRCIDHLSEEKGHDKLLLNDLKMCGFKIDDFKALSSTQALFQTQYYWIQHKSPTSFLGYVILLEGLAVTFGPKLNKLVAKHKGKSFIAIHSEDDFDHIEKAFAVIEALPKTEQELAIQNLELSADLYISMLKELADTSALNVRSA